MDVWLFILLNMAVSVLLPMPVAVRSKGCVYGRSFAGIMGSNPAGVWTSVVSVMCCQVEVSASGWSLVQRNPTDCRVSK